MALPYSFGNQTTPNTSWLDSNYGALGSLTWIPCSVSGTNTIAFTPITNTPAVSSYYQGLVVTGTAAAANTGAAVANVSAIGNKNIYLDTSSGPIALSGGEIQTNNEIVLAYDTNLGSGAGGFHLINSPPVATNSFILGLTGLGYPWCGFVNKIRNAGLSVWSRGTIGTITAGTSAMTADGIVVSATGGSVTWQQIAPPSFGQNFYGYYSLQINGSSANTDVTVRFPIESLIAAELEKGANTTFQFSYYNDGLGAITPTLTVKQAGSQDNYGSPITITGPVAMSALRTGFIHTGTDAYIFTPGSSTTLTLGMCIDVDFGAIGSGASIALWGFDYRQTNNGTAGGNNTTNQPTPEIPPPHLEQLYCARYLPAWNPSAASVTVATANGGATTVTWGAPFNFLVPTRVAPTSISISSASNFSLFTYAGAVAAPCTSINFNALTSTTQGFVTGTTAGSLTVNAPYLLASNTTGAQILFTGAEIMGA